MSTTQAMAIPAEARDRAPSLAEVRRLLGRDVFRPKALAFWLDMTLAAAIGWVALWGATLAFEEQAWAKAAGMVVIAAFAFLRAVLFIHEISHFKKGVLPGFRLAWDVLVGIPLMVPSWFYDSHLDHHRKNLYGTIADPEYLPLAHTGRFAIVFFVLHTALVPLALILRFGVLGPLSWVLPPLRRLVEERMSSLVINPDYVRTRPVGRDRWIWFGTELVIAAWIAGVAWALVTNTLPLSALYMWAAASALVAVINQIRTLAAHHYESVGTAVTTGEQLLDSINVLGWPLATELVFPVGLKYHGLHHFAPDIPYHELAGAHRVLMNRLPIESSYRTTEHQSVWSVIAQLWRAAGRTSGRPSTWKK